MPEEPRLADDVDPNKLLVEIVQGLLIAHARLDHMETALQANIDHLRTQGVLSLAADIKAERLAEQQRFDDLQSRLKHLISSEAAQKSFGQAESTKQSENWKNLLQFLQSFRTASAISAADLKKHTTDETKSLSEHLTSVVKLINMSEVKRSAEIRRVRLLLYWLVFFSVSLIGLLAADTYKLWIR